METAVKTEKELLAKEYGSNILKLIEYILTIEDRTERTQQAKLLKELIIKMNPSLLYTENIDEKVWNIIYIMSNLKLDVDVEFNKISLDALHQKPIKVEYSINRPTYKHYGKNIELIVGKVVAEKDEEKRTEAIIGLGKLMKMFYGNWNKETADNRIIANQISKLSNGKIIVSEELLQIPTIFDTKKLNKTNINQNSVINKPISVPKRLKPSNNSKNLGGSNNLNRNRNIKK